MEAPVFPQLRPPSASTCTPDLCQADSGHPIPRDLECDQPVHLRRVPTAQTGGHVATLVTPWFFPPSAWWVVLGEPELKSVQANFFFPFLTVSCRRR